MLEEFTRYENAYVQISARLFEIKTDPLRTDIYFRNVCNRNLSCKASYVDLRNIKNEIKTIDLPIVISGNNVSIFKEYVSDDGVNLSFYDSKTGNPLIKFNVSPKSCQLLVISNSHDPPF